MSIKIQYLCDFNVDVTDVKVACLQAFEKLCESKSFKCVLVDESDGVLCFHIETNMVKVPYTLWNDVFVLVLYHDNADSVPNYKEHVLTDEFIHKLVPGDESNFAICISACKYKNNIELHIVSREIWKLYHATWFMKNMFNLFDNEYDKLSNEIDILHNILYMYRDIPEYRISRPRRNWAEKRLKELENENIEYEPF